MIVLQIVLTLLLIFAFIFSIRLLLELSTNLPNGVLFESLGMFFFLIAILGVSDLLGWCVFFVWTVL
jgi:hypothetical protein